MRTHTFYANNCPTCNQPASTPRRRRDQHGKIVEGCVDHFHTGQIVSLSESATWHGRPESKRIRAAMKRSRMGGVTECVSRNFGKETNLIKALRA